MLHHFPDASQPKSFRTTTLVVAAALALAAACGTGIAAFSGLLPASDEVAVKMTATPLIDIWRSEPDSAAGLPSGDKDSDVAAE